MKIYINNIRIENTLGRTISAESLCDMMNIPKKNAIVCDEDMNEVPFGKTFIVNEKDHFFIIRRVVSGA